MSLTDESWVVDVLPDDSIDGSSDSLEVDGFDESELSDDSSEDVLLELLDDATCESLVDESLVDECFDDCGLADESLDEA